MPLNESTAAGTAEKFIRAAILADAELVAVIGDRVRKGKAKHGDVFPLVVYAYQTGSYQHYVGAVRARTVINYSVRAIIRLPEAASGQLDAVAARIDKLLEQAGSGLVNNVEATVPISQTYTLDGVDYEERGAIYQVTIIGG